MDLSDPLVRDKAQQVNWVTIHRVCGELAVSRSIGDPDYKGFVSGKKVDAYFNWPDNHDQIFYADLVIPDPEFQSCDIASSDEFLVIASDGLWDVVSGDEAISRISHCFASGMSPTATAEELCDLAIKLGSSDNVTIVIVAFIHNKEDS
jgi:serine/threonine protein phosphatase PrpC